MSEGAMAARLKEKNPEFLWKPISDKFGAGTPDRCVLWRGTGKSAWVELKLLKSLPTRQCKVGLKPKQAAWLREWQKEGGFSALIVGVKDEKKVAVFAGGFREIAQDGLAREQFELISYEKVSEVLKRLMSN